MARDGRKSGGSMIGTKYPIPDDRAFGTTGEIAHRHEEAHQESPTAFSQIGPEDNSGMNVAEMDQNPDNRSGRFKWSRGV
jgi:hypothetical protein